MHNKLRRTINRAFWGMALIASGIFVGCKAEADRPDPPHPIDIRQDVTVKLRLTVRNALKDPSSGEIHDAVLYLAEREPDGVSGYYTLCGRVNGKNSYGAVAGDTGFIASQYLKNNNGTWMQGGQLLFFENESEDYSMYRDRLCQNAPKRK